MTESSSPAVSGGANGARLPESEGLFRLLFENTADSILIIDPEQGTCIDCNDAAVKMSRGGTREWLMSQNLARLAPERQPDGSVSSERLKEFVAEAMRGGSPRLEWMALRRDGEEFPLEVLATSIEMRGRRLLAVISREISERKRAEARIQQQNQALEARVRERTVELVQANEQLKAEIKGRQRREKIQRALYQISEASHTTEDLNSLYRQIHETIRGVIHARNFYIALRDPGTELVHFSYFVDEMDPLPAPVKLVTGPTARVLRAGQPLLVYRREPGGSAMVEPGGQVYHAETGSAAAVWLGVPLSVGGRALGVMAVQDYHDPKAYGEEEKRLLTFIGEQTAQAIERKSSEQALRESEQKFRALFEATSQGVMLHDDQAFLEVNPAAVRILDFDSVDEVLGRHPADISPPRQPNGVPSDEMARRHIADCIQRGSTRFDWVCRNSKGVDIPLEVILTRIQMGGRSILQAVIIDISERKRAEAELLKALAREKELSQLKGNFVSLVSHEFRTPLGIIMSSAEILASYLQELEPEERRQHLESIRKNTRRMANLMEEVLLLGMTEAGKLEFRPVTLDLAGFCRRLTDELPAGGRTCRIQFEDRLAAAPAFADERLLRHVFTNLLTNAIKYSEPGGAVTFAIARDGADAVCMVRDEGIGIPDADQEWLFQAFHRGRNVGNVPGTGLGLVIVKRCLELHGGQVRVESRLGRGTTVTVRFPAFAPQ